MAAGPELKGGDTVAGGRDGLCCWLGVAWLEKEKKEERKWKKKMKKENRKIEKGIEKKIEKMRK